MTGSAGGAGPSVERRVAARVLLFDQRDRLLLIHGFDPADRAREWWFTPGGGLEPGEGLRAAARREVLEETGIDGFELGPAVWRRRTAFEFDGRRLAQEEWFFPGRTARTDVDVSGRTGLERRSTDEVRWWRLPDLERTEETVYPDGLGRLVRELADDLVDYRFWSGDRARRDSPRWLRPQLEGEWAHACFPPDGGA